MLLILTLIIINVVLFYLKDKLSIKYYNFFDGKKIKIN